MLVSFSGSHSLKVSVSITTDQLARSVLIAGGNDILGGRELDNETENIGRCALCYAALNWMMKCDGRLEVYLKLI